MTARRPATACRVEAETGVVEKATPTAAVLTAASGERILGI
jgi:hypothetical protein